MSYTYLGTKQGTTAAAQRAVQLTLTDGAQVLFTSHHADAVCAVLHANRPEIVRCAGFDADAQGDGRATLAGVDPPRRPKP